MVRDDPHADVVLRLTRSITLPRDIGGQVDDRPQQVGVIVAQDILLDDRNPLEAGAGVDRRGRQRIHLAIRVALELHENEVPELEPAAAVRVWLLAKLARIDVVQAKAVVNLGARSAGAGVAHLPEIVLGAASDDALVGKARDVLPNCSGFVVGRREPLLASEDRNDEALGVELERVDEVVPGKFDRVALEVVPKREVPEHLEEGVVPRGDPDVLEIVVLAADTDALLRRSSARIRPLFLTGEDVLELHHACVREHERRIIRRDERTRSDPLVLALREEPKERFPNLG